MPADPDPGADLWLFRAGIRAARHAIYFRITDYGIAVIRVLHDRMDARRHLY